jgi:cephalosporin hydroxylase
MNIKKTIKKILNETKHNERVSFDSKSLYEGHLQVTYRGIKAIRCPFDYVIYQMIVNEVKPDLIIEIGTSEGGSAIYLADLMDASDIQGEIHSIDITSKAEQNVKINSRIKLFTNGWENYDINLATKFKTILIIEDAAHTYECTIGALEKFNKLVSLGSYLIVEDGIIDDLGMSKEFNGGPLRAIKEFLPKHPEFIIDRKWCDMFGRNATFNVNGYLKRVK